MTSEQPFYGPWNRLLNTMFPVDTIFEVVPQYLPVTSHGAFDSFVLVIYAEAMPVFIIEVKPPDDFRLPLKRQEADVQIRKRLIDVADDVNIPMLHGVSAFGTKIAFYKYTPDARSMEPRSITSEPGLEPDTAPREWWAFDILEEEGAQKFRNVVEEVKEKYGHVSL